LHQNYFPIIWQVNIREKFIAALVSKDIFVDKMFYQVKPKKPSFSINVLLALLNSTLIRLIIESNSLIMQGQSTLAIYMVNDLLNSLIVKPNFISDGRFKIIKNVLSSKVETIFKEIGSSTPEEVSLDKIKPERREIDKIIMGDVLGLTDEEQLEVYRATIDLVKSRIEKAKSAGTKKRKGGIYTNAIKDTIIKKIREE